MQPEPGARDDVDGGDSLEREKIREVPRLWLSLDRHDAKEHAERETQDSENAREDDLGALARARVEVRQVQVAEHHGREGDEGAVRRRDHRAHRRGQQHRRRKLPAAARRSHLVGHSSERPESSVVLGTQHSDSHPSGDHGGKLHDEEGEVHASQPQLERLGILGDEKAHDEVGEHRRSQHHLEDEGRVGGGAPAFVAVGDVVELAVPEGVSLEEVV
mmetsp:Transcript_46941/g.110532  ORF Transcript_46941/g.110532 Transcript_46941/m.110532 type:complete len:217 (-) Transcript_46941:820-1470(-)